MAISKIYRLCHTVFHLCLFVCTGYGGAVWAQTVASLQDVDFGTAVVTNNNAQHEIVISPGGGFTNDTEIVFISNPIAGQYRLTGATPGQTITSVTFMVDQQMIGAGEDFIIDNFNATFPATADGTGSALIDVGGRLRTTGNFTNYNSSTIFTGMVTVTVNLL